MYRDGQKVCPRLRELARGQEAVSRSRTNFFGYLCMYHDTLSLGYMNVTGSRIFLCPPLLIPPCFPAAIISEMIALERKSRKLLQGDYTGLNTINYLVGCLQDMAFEIVSLKHHL